jgi:hypothetical protein
VFFREKGGGDTMKFRRDLIIVALATFCLTATLFMVRTTLSNSSALGEYDAWNDLNSDGAIDIFDAITLASVFGTSGDPTKNVNVMNWPVTTQKTVFYQQTISTSSAVYNASGFGHIHLLWDVSGLVDPENVTIRVYSHIYDPDGLGYYTTYLSPMVVTSDNIEGSASFPVPGEMFGFQMSLGIGTTASVNLAYYLTYA